MPPNKPNKPTGKWGGSKIPAKPKSTGNTPVPYAPGKGPSSYQSRAASIKANVGASYTQPPKPTFKSEMAKMMAQDGMLEAYKTQAAKAGYGSLIKPITFGGTEPQTSSGGGSGSGGSSGGSAIPEPIPLEPSAPVDPMAELKALLGALPQGPTGLPELQGAYGNLQSTYDQSRTDTTGAYDEAKAAIQKMYGDTATAYEGGGNTDYLKALQGLNTQNQNTNVGTIDILKGVRGNYLSDMGTAVASRGAAAQEDMLKLFNELKMSREKEITQQWMEQQQALAEAALEAAGGGGSGGGGGGRGYSSGGSGSTSEQLVDTDTAVDKGTIISPETIAYLNEVMARDPETGASLQRYYNLHPNETGSILATAQKDFDNAGIPSATALKSALKGMAGLKKGSWSNLGKAVQKAQTNKAKAAKLLDAAAGLPGVYGNAKTVQTVTGQSKKTTKYPKVTK